MKKDEGSTQGSKGSQKTPGDIFVEVVCEMYDRHDDAFKALAKEIGDATDDQMMAIEELFDALQEASRAVGTIARAMWRHVVAAQKMRPLIVEAIRRRKRFDALREGMGVN